MEMLTKKHLKVFGEQFLGGRTYMFTMLPGANSNWSSVRQPQKSSAVVFITSGRQIRISKSSNFVEH